MKNIELGKWTINFDKEYRVVKDNNTLIAIDNEREPIAIVSVNADGNLRIERTYYAMMYEIIADENTLNFIAVED